MAVDTDFAADPAADPAIFASLPRIPTTLARSTNTPTAGQVSLHSDLLLRGSRPNASDRRRAWLTLRYAAGEVHPLPSFEPWFVPAVHCRGELPAHWPHRRRPEGEHPEKMKDFTGDFDGNPVAASN